MNQSRHINKLVKKQVLQEMGNNRLRLKTLIESIRWLTFQTCALRGHDESPNSKSKGNIIELIKLLTSYNDQVNGVVMENTPHNAKYTSPKIQKEILHIFTNKVRNVIHEEIEDAKFCILVDEARDESKREQIAIILRFVDKDGFIREPFFYIVHVKDTIVLTLKNEISLFLKDCPYAYYVHCWAHKLQLALVAASREAILMRMFSATCSVINTISNERSNYSQRGDAEVAYMVLTSFEFILILHMMKKIMGITNALCQSLQQNFQDIVCQEPNDGWESLLTDVKSFCEKHQINIPDMNDQYTRGRGKSRCQVEKSTEHHFRIDKFFATIDFQLQELNNRFNDHTIDLFILSAALNSKCAYKSFKIDDIYKLVEKFCPQDFTEQEKFFLRIQLQHYELDVLTHLDFQDMSTLSELCRRLAISEKSKIYYLIDKLIRLLLTLPVSTATTERAFSAMKLIKTRLRTRIEDEFLANHLLVYIEKKIVKNFTLEMIMDEFYSMKDHRRA
ncbi:hypothetical protein I3842_10G129500 [Carya illinoinensis]|uniref:Zinc finger MYM-type protein 1-like n=1 Tax=Carya illinoinensis TaxID=32201 RepID=A0A922J4A6_CARIL|nr:hypothetical protein I3842_10G129500 [Carya illinoinensis]